MLFVYVFADVQKGDRMKKRILALLIALLIVPGVCGCDRAPKQYDGRMKYAGGNTAYEVLIDTETGICYLKTASGGVCVMVNQDGTPYVANGWRDYAE